MNIHDVYGNNSCTSVFVDDVMFSHGPNRPTDTSLESATKRIIYRDSPGGADKL